MKKAFYTLTVLFFVHSLSAQSGVGIGTANPQAMLHVDTGSVLFSYPANDIFNTPVNPPATGAGFRMMWYPAKAAFRAGGVTGKQWNKDSIGRFSTAFGYDTRAKGFGSFAAGYYSLASGNGSFASGRGGIASGDDSQAFGYESVASGHSSFVFGTSNEAIGYNAIAGGFNNAATGDFSFAYGYELMAKSGVAFGLHNDRSDVPTGNYFNPGPTNRLFQIGNGESVYNRHNALTVLYNGNTGIGELTPSSKLHVTANGSPIAPQLLLQETQSEYARLSFKNAATTNFWTVAALPATTNASAQLNFFWQGYGDILKIYGNGNATLAGTLTQNSDARLKTNIKPLHHSLASLNQLSGYRYQWKDKARDNAVQIGLLAQEVQSVFPELVKEDEKGTLSVNYSGLVPVLIDAVKEQQKEINELRKQVQSLLKAVSNGAQKPLVD